MSGRLQRGRLPLLVAAALVAAFLGAWAVTLVVIGLLQTPVGRIAGLYGSDFRLQGLDLAASLGLIGASIALAESIAAHPQITLRSDRAALLRGVELRLDVERQLGLEALGQRGAEGIEWFRSGDGRGGRQID